MTERVWCDWCWRMCRDLGTTRREAAACALRCVRASRGRIKADREALRAGGTK